MKKLLFLLILFSQCKQPGIAPEAIGPLPSDAQVNYQRMEFNGFVHFNMNTFSNMEWGYGDESPSQFNPTELDAEQWVSIMKDAGMKGVIITAKHHDGFCLWPSAYTEHSIKNSPYKDGKGDILRELSDACKKYGLKFGVYLSPWDRNHADYGTPEYITYFRNQLRELLTNYGDIFEVWFDGANGGDGYYGGANEVRKVDKLTYYDWENTYDIIRELQPEAIIFSDAGPGCRWIGNEHGFAYPTTWSMLVVDSVYGGMPEYGSKYSMGQEHGTAWVPGEADVSIRPGWYYHEHEDHKVKSLADLMEIYYRSVGQNSTLLLNFPVDKRGLIHEKDKEQVLKMAAKIKEDFSNNLVANASIKAESDRGSDFDAAKAIDSDIETYWAAEDGNLKGSLTLQFDKEETINRVVLQEQIRLGQRIKTFNIEANINGQWDIIANGTTVGYKRIFKFDPIQTKSLRINITDARACPTISNIEVYHAPSLLSAPKIKRSRMGLITMEIPENGPQIRYTTDGSTPTANSDIFKGNIRFPRGGLLKAIAVDGNRQSEVAIADMDMGPGKWYVLNAGSSSQQAIDENPDTWWAGNELIIDLNENLRLLGFTYLPTQQRYPTGFIEKYEFYTSLDGKIWTLAKKGEFGNIVNSPIKQSVKFDKVEAAYIKIKAIKTADGNPASFAELGIITKG
ncbi:alpha-L-fucosidase [Portibacter lacus]|uniref:alpha-L-fucosidase n=1 Tax=Portibacter lacus TaxID=1099794 RepID=A0AA37WCU1_9BACT|nr:alpha-L-fucosidase [Portibacter lacus]GLR16228.1 hypothetical protein GCM10007940_08430 [Portibacter lacus]